MPMPPLLGRIVNDLAGRDFMVVDEVSGRQVVAFTDFDGRQLLEWEAAAVTPENLEFMDEEGQEDADVVADQEKAAEDAVVRGVEEANDAADDDQSYSSSEDDDRDDYDYDHENAVDPGFRDDGLNHAYLWWLEHKNDNWCYIYVTLGTNLMIDGDPPVTLFMCTDFDHDYADHTRERYEPVAFHTIEEWEAYAPRIDACITAAREVIEAEVSEEDTDVEK